MARQPFFTGNYGSALAQIDTRPIMQGAAAQAAAYQGIGQNIGGAIEKYQLNKVKRAKLTGDIEAYLKENPDYINESTMTGDEAADKKNMTQFEKFAAGDLNMAGLEGLAGKLARGDTLRKNKLLEESQMIQNQMRKFNFGVQQELRDTTVQLQKDKGTISSLSTAIAKETNPQRKELLQGKLASAIADLGENPAKRAERIAQREEAAATRQALGGPKGVGALAARTTIAGVEQAEASVGETEGKEYYYKSKADTDRLAAEQKATTDRLTAYAKLHPGFKAKYDPLNSVKESLLSETLENIKGERVLFKDYLEGNQEDPDMYPMTGMAAKLDGMLKSYDKQIEALMQGENVQVLEPETGGMGGGTGGALPSAISPGMTPAQADAAKTARIAEIRTLIDNLNTEEDNLGAPGQSMTTYPVAGGMGGSAPTTAPQTVGHISQRRQQIPIEIQELRAELTQLANL